MNDPRITDSVRNTASLVSAISQEVAALREDNKYMKEMLRAIKKSVTRKYDKKEMNES